MPHEFRGWFYVTVIGRAYRHPTWLEGATSIEWREVFAQWLSTKTRPVGPMDVTFEAAMAGEIKQ